VANKLTDARRVEIDDIRAIMGAESGRRLMSRLMVNAGVFRCSYNGQSNQTVFNEGRRSVGLFIHEELRECCPALYMKMLEENTHD